MVCIDFTGCTNEERFWVCGPQGIDGGLHAFTLGVGLVDGERERLVDFIHAAIQFLVQDRDHPDIQYLAATRLLISDGAWAIIRSHNRLASERTPWSYGGTSSGPTVATWYAMRFDVPALRRAVPSYPLLCYAGAQYTVSRVLYYAACGIVCCAAVRLAGW